MLPSTSQKWLKRDVLRPAPDNPDFEPKIRLSPTAPASGGFQIVSESGKTDAQVEALLQARYDAKKAKDFTEADRIRDDLKAMGVEITDIPGGVRWKR